CEDTTCLERIVKARAAATVRGRIADRLFFRRWDRWKDGTRSHIWKVPAAMSDGAPAVDLTPGDRDAPPFEVGGGVAWSVSPDGKELVYASNPDRDEALSTNADLYVTPLAEGGAPRNLTSANPAYDGNPRFSPDGKWIAYRAQRRPGFES